MHSMLAHWVPPLERSKFAALVYAGRFIQYIFFVMNINRTNIARFFLRFKFRNCHLVTSEWLAMLLRILGWLATRVLFIRRLRPYMVCVLADVHI